MKSALFSLALGAGLASSATAQTATFQPLGVYSGGVVAAPNSHATGVSQSGMVVGFAQGVDAATQLAVTVALFRTATGAWQTVPSTGYSTALAITPDGATIAGMGPVQLPSGLFGPFIYHPTGQPAFPAITTGRFQALSADGTVAVGGSGASAIRWTQAGGAQNFGTVPSWPGTSALATGVSADGSTAAGWVMGPLGTQAFKWTSPGGAVPLGFLNPTAGSQFSQATGVSADGSTIVGTSTNAAGALQAFVYFLPGGMRPVPLLAGATGSAAYAVSRDGSVIVGQTTMPGGPTAFYWDRIRGRRDLRDFLLSMGATGLSGWTLVSATAISPDGAYIVGDGRDAQGRAQAWLARIPAFCYANCDSSTATPALNVADFICYLGRFAAGDAYANCDGSTQPPVINVGDFVCFQQRFAAGCP